MPTIAIFGAGPGLGRSVAEKFGREGYTVALVARNKDKLEKLAKELRREGITAHAIPGDLMASAEIGKLATHIRETAGDPDVIYYAPTSPDMTFVPAAELTPEAIEANTTLLLTTFAALVSEFLPHMVAQKSGAILTAQGTTALQGTPRMSGPGPAMAAQRNYLQALQKELAPSNVFVGRLYISALIEHSAIHQSLQAAGKSVPSIGLVNPDKLADKLWAMQKKGRPHEAAAPAAGKVLARLMATAPVQKLMTKYTS